jgi:hypothetical protein
MRPEGILEHPTIHSALTNVLADQHHKTPSGLSVVNTTLSVSPLPGGPGQWDISIPEETIAIRFAFRSVHTTEPGGTAGLVGIATRSQLEAATASLGGHGTPSTAAYAATYAKAAAALYLSHKIWSNAGLDIALTDAYLTLTGPSTRVFRTTWTNFAAGFRTLSVRGELLLWY